MLLNYLKIAFRNIIKQKLFSTINIFGLAIGLATSIFIILFIQDELSYDTIHKDLPLIHRINLNGKIADQEFTVTNSCPPLGIAMVNEIPEVSHQVRISRLDDLVIKTDTESIIEDNDIFIADSNFFSFFDFGLIEGNRTTVLNRPHTMVITNKLAIKYFGRKDVLGEQVTLFGDDVYKITGIADVVPSNSHFHFDMILSGLPFDQFKSDRWMSNNLITYIKVVANSDMSVVNKKITDLTIKRAGPELEQFMGISFDQFFAQGNKYGYSTFPVKDIHLKGHFDYELEANSDIKYVYLFALIAIFIIVIACINFMNLSTAKSSGRAKEVGLRKTLGSSRGLLIRQFLSESIIYSLAAGVLAIIIMTIALPYFNSLTGKAIAYSSIFSFNMLLVITATTFFVGVLSGSYPAFYLTKFEVSTVLKGIVSSGTKSGRLRGTLVVLQFSISIILIICTAIVFQQLRYTQNVNLGFNKNNTLILENTESLDDNRNSFKNLIMSTTNVLAASYTNNTIPGVNNTTIFRKWGTEEDHLVGTYFGDYEHVDALGYSIVEGRNFDRDYPSDSTAVLINEATVAEMGWEDPIGQQIYLPGDENGIALTVIGVLKDFNFESLHTRIRPLILQFTKQSSKMLIRFDGNNIPATISKIETEWNKMDSGQPFQYSFLSDEFNTLYKSEEKLGQIFYLFTTVAILIACLGLFGLAAFIAEQRTKEIGIRKVLGASVIGLINLMSVEFIKYVVIALFIAIYPAYWFMSQWLESFAYRIGLSPSVFLFSGVLALAIALLTVSYQSIKAASTNPVKSLKYE